MSTIVYRISVLLGTILADVPVGTHLGWFWLLWALVSGRFLLRECRHEMLAQSARQRIWTAAKNDAVFLA